MWVGANALLDDISKDEAEYPKACRTGQQEKRRECEALGWCTALLPGWAREVTVAPDVATRLRPAELVTNLA